MCCHAAQAPAAVAGGQAVGEDSWKAADPYRFLPAPESNTMAHTEVMFSDGHVERYCNTEAQLAAHLRATGGKVLFLPQTDNPAMSMIHDAGTKLKSQLTEARLYRDHSSPCATRPHKGTSIAGFQESTYFSVLTIKAVDIASLVTGLCVAARPARVPLYLSAIWLLFSSTSSPDDPVIVGVRM
jgi:hypothetical protein